MKTNNYWEGEVFPAVVSTDCVYRLTPHNFDHALYYERTDRNIGWITQEEQETLRNSTVGVAGCGGMGGLIAATFIRLGVGTLKIADCEDFDTSNLNRQFAATRNSIGRSKALATAQMLREITEDTTIVVYPQGINEETVDDFLEGCDVVCDEIEFWAVGARILLHQKARAHATPIFNCDTVGHRSYLFKFTDKSMTVEEMLSFDYEEGKRLQEAIHKSTATEKEVHFVMGAVLNTFAPEVPEYAQQLSGYSMVEALHKRLYHEGKASIISTNPPMASGFIANHVLWYLLEGSSVVRVGIKVPLAPEYLYIDAFETAILGGRTPAKQRSDG